MRFIKSIGILFLMTLSVWLSGCKEEKKKEPEVVNLQFATKELLMKEGDVERIIYLVSPSNASISWESSNPEVAVVAGGIVSALKMGHATIIGKAGDSEQKCEVSVQSASGKDMGLNSYYQELTVNGTFQFECVSSYGTEFVWSSDNETVATIDAETGLATGHKAGVAKITATIAGHSVSAHVYIEHEWGDYELVWTEDFSGTELDQTVWNIEVGAGNYANKERQFYTREAKNLRVKDGCLEIELVKETEPDNSNTRQQYASSARINSRGKKSFRYGKIEGRISFPSGGGTWPAFWMMGVNGNWPYGGEIDIVEHIGNQPRYTSFAVHTADANTGNGKQWHSGWTASESMEDSFHVYGIEWREEESRGCDQIAFTVDGEIRAVVTENASHLNEKYYWPFNEEHYFILNMALGGIMGGNVDQSIFDNPVIMKVDWIKVYQRSEK